MPVLYANRASSTLAAGITNSATSLSVAAGHGARFPAITAPDYFYATLDDSAGNVEIVRVTARSTDTFTIVRGQDGTSGLAFSAGATIELRVVKAMLDDFKLDAADTRVRVATTGNITLSGLQTIDGVSVAAGDRVLVRSQSTAANNGVYIASASTWTRALDADSPEDVAGKVVSVTAGSLNGGLSFKTLYKTTDGAIGTAFQLWNAVVTVGGNWGISITGNAGSATQLLNARTLWGQSFSGGADVSGNLTSVGNITGTAGVALTATAAQLTLAATGANSVSIQTNGVERLRAYSGGGVLINDTLFVGRTNATDEGGQINLQRAVDNASMYGLDVYGSTTAPVLRLLNIANSSALLAQFDSAGNFAVTGAIIENGQTVSSNYTVTSGRNAMSAGPITIASNVTVTVSSGSTWVIV